MSFGNFLLGVAEGLDRGVEAGDRISTAMDKKASRDAAKKVANDGKLQASMASTGLDPVRTPAPVGGAPYKGVGPPVPTAAPAAAPATTPATAPPPVPATATAAPPTVAAQPRASLQPQYAPPAAMMGVNSPTYAVSFPGAIPANYGVLGPYDQRPY